MNKRSAPPDDALLMKLIRAIVADDAGDAAKLMAQAPALARHRLQIGASRQGPGGFFLEEFKHHLYAGDTALHAAAAGYRVSIGRGLIEQGADVKGANRRGAQPLHYAADGGPGSPHWDPGAQAEMIALLVSRGADPDVFDKSGVAPLHRAVRHRCLAAVDALLRNGSDISLRNKSGSTPLHLAVQNTGASGSGSAESKALQKEIIVRLLQGGANPMSRDGRGRTVRQSIQADWIQSLF